MDTEATTLESGLAKIDSMSVDEINNMDWDFSSDNFLDGIVDSDFQETGSKEPASVYTDEQDNYSDEPNTITNIPEGWEQLFQPIKTSAGEITLNNMQEVMTLVKKGMDSQSLSNELSPHRKAIHTLEKAKLLDANKINHMIDVMNGDPNAIRQLIADKQVNIDDIDNDNPLKYSPRNHTPSDAELSFADVTKKLNSTPHGAKAISVVVNEWDEDSKRRIVSVPANLLYLADQIENGQYDKIMGEITRGRMLGSIPASESLVDSYSRVGHQLFGDSANASPSPQQQQSQPQQRQVDQSGRDRVGRAPRADNRKGNPTIESLEKLSDADFNKEFERLFNFS